MSIILNSSGGGSVTIQEPTTASNLTATLPAATGTVMVSGNMPAFSAYPSTLTAIPTATFTKIIYDTKQFDTATCFNTTTSQYTPNVAGYYQFNACNGSAGASTGANNFICFYKNGSLALIGSSSGSANTNPSWLVSSLIYMNGTTDYVSVYIYQNSGLTLNSATSGTWTFSGSLVRAA